MIWTNFLSCWFLRREIVPLMHFVKWLLVYFLHYYFHLLCPPIPPLLPLLPLATVAVAAIAGTEKLPRSGKRVVTTISLTRNAAVNTITHVPRILTLPGSLQQTHMSSFFPLSITCFPHSGEFCNYCSQLDYFVWIDFSVWSCKLWIFWGVLDDLDSCWFKFALLYIIF